MLQGEQFGRHGVQIESTQEESDFTVYTWDFGCVFAHI